MRAEIDILMFILPFSFGWFYLRAIQIVKSQRTSWITFTVFAPKL